MLTLQDELHSNHHNHRTCISHIPQDSEEVEADNSNNVAMHGKYQSSRKHIISIILDQQKQQIQNGQKMNNKTLTIMTNKNMERLKA
jgi:hypothetical protein